MKRYTGVGYTIYMHTNRVNGKVYIGQTRCKDLTRRWAGGHGYKASYYFFSAIVRYGWLNFDHEILETGLTREQADERERFYIEKYRARNPRYGYNIQSGGADGREFSSKGFKTVLNNLKKGTTGCSVVVFDANGKRLKEFSSMKSAARFVGCNAPVISKACKHGRGTCRGYIVRYAVEVEGVYQLPDDEVFKPHAQPGEWSPVAMYDLDGNFVRQFPSVSQAAEFVGCPQPSISSCLSKSNHQKSTRGYMWSYVRDGACPEKIDPYVRKKVKPRNVAPVCQYDRFTGEKLATYPSYSDAAKAMNCSLEAIRKCALGDAKTSCGYIWRLETDALDSVEPVLAIGGR